MLTRILHNSATLCAFLDELHLTLSQPQLHHVRNLVDALLVCDGDKTLAALQRQFVECVDVSNMADTLRIAPWTAAMIRQPARLFVLESAIARARERGTLDAVYISLDDSVAVKHKNTKHLEPVDWHFDHIESRPGHPRYFNGLAYLDCNVWIGGEPITFDVAIYLRECTARHINRQRVPEAHMPFRSKMTLARQMLQTLGLLLPPLLPASVPVYVLHDAWYASARLILCAHRQRWHTITALKSNRKLDRRPLTQHTQALWHQRYEPVIVSATDGAKTTYYTRSLLGRLEDLAFDVRVIDSKRHPRAPRSAYFGCTDLGLEPQTALQIYASRWGCETDNVYLKTRLGLGDFRVRSYEAVDKYIAVVQVGLLYLQWRLLNERTADLQNPADVIRRHRDEHTRDWLSGACQEAIATGDLDAVLQRYLRLDA